MTLGVIIIFAETSGLENPFVENPFNFIFCSPAVVGNLWDVTDVDSDKFTKHLLQLWFQGDLSLTQCVTQSRHVANMKYINSAASIVYGMPVYVKDLK